MLSLALPIRARPLTGYMLALALTLLALWLRLSLGEWLGSYPFLTFVIAIVLTAFLCGGGPAILATVVGGVCADHYLSPPSGSGWVGILLYAALAGITIALTEGMFRRYAAQIASESALRALTIELEDRIAERTAALHTEMLEHGRAQAQLRQMHKMESIGQLTGGIAHDFNNMLAIVMGSLDMAKRRLAKGELARADTAIDNAAEGARRAAVLTARLLAFSRQQPLEPRPLDANALVPGMSEMLRRTIGEHIRVETVLAGGLWHVFADAAQLENAIVNLAVNARDAMPDGGRVTIETANTELDDRYAAAHADVTPGQYVLVSITDTGTGMPPEVAERAFDPFYTTKDVGKGTGLGLSQVFGYVRQSGGHVKIYSEVGHGTTIKIYLPRHRGLAPRDDARGEAADAVPAGDPGLIVLVVEDEAEVRYMSVDALRDLGYTVMQASDAGQALEQIAAQPRIDLLFTDIMMPGMNGRQLADKALELRPDLRVLFTTGYTRNAVVHNGMLDAGVAFLAKPFTMAQLATKVHAVLRGEGVNRPE